MQEKGNLSINSENFMPIIKKWLYTDKDIFIRELVSNACDAVTKLQKLSMMGEADIPAEEAYEIHVVLDQDKKTLQIIDNGIGMTADEIKKYINQIAFSGATDFLSKFEGKTEDEGSDIIEHFGLSFYSAIIVADTVEIDSLSYQKGAEPAKWRCNGGIDKEMEAGERTERGTTITLFIGADGEEMRRRVSGIGRSVVIEITEEEDLDLEILNMKRRSTVLSGLYALDDYGSGYSNEGNLITLDPDFIKIDISIIRGIESDPDKQEVVRNIVSYAHQRGMQIVAEGIETAAELRTSRALGADLFQGYFLSRPGAVPSALAAPAQEILRELPHGAEEHR